MQAREGEECKRLPRPRHTPSRTELSPRDRVPLRLTGAGILANVNPGRFTYPYEISVTDKSVALVRNRSAICVLSDESEGVSIQSSISQRTYIRESHSFVTPSIEQGT